MKPVLVTGASGFVGWHVARELAEAGTPVRAMTRGRNAVRELPAQYGERFEVVTGDLQDRASLDGAVAGCGRTIRRSGRGWRIWSALRRPMGAGRGAGV